MLGSYIYEKKGRKQDWADGVVRHDTKSAILVGSFGTKIVCWKCKGKNIQAIVPPFTVTALGHSEKRATGGKAEGDQEVTLGRLSADHTLCSVTALS